MSKTVKRCCGFCRFISNLSDDSRREEPNVMGCCLIDGHFVTTDEKGCRKWKECAPSGGINGE